jgi:hypothetical protein
MSVETSATALDHLADEPRWVAWVTADRGGKPAKVPYSFRGGRAKADDPSTWGTRAEARTRFDTIARRIVIEPRKGGLGIMLGDVGDATYLAGIDLDSCLDEDGRLAQWADAILVATASYAEVSPSGRGLKIFFYTRVADARSFLDLVGITNPNQWGLKRTIGANGADHGPAIEIYFSHRYFTVTGRHWSTQPDKIPMLEWPDLERLAALIPAAPAAAAVGTRSRRGNGRDTSRSAAAFRKAAELRRAGASFAEMVATLRSDPETADWAHEKGDAAGGREYHRIWEKTEPGGRSASRSAASRPHGALSALIKEFNSRYAVVNENGLAVVYEQMIDPIRDRKVLVRIKFPDLKKFYQNRLITVPRADGASVTKSAADWWLNHEHRRQYLGGVLFDPAGNAPENCWNLWSGFSVEPTRGDWSLMQAHIRKVICGANDALAEYLLNWIARMFQQPNRPGEVAVVIRGRKGSGKGILGVWLIRAWGQHGLHITNAKHLVGNFNAHLRDCVALFADEAFFAGDKQHEGVLKGLITEPTLPIEGKYQNVIEVLNMLHVIMASNADWVIPASQDERRYLVLDAADNRIGDRRYFADIAAQMENGGLAAMIWDMLRRDIRGFEVRDLPSTDALTEQKKYSLDSLHRWWLAVLERGFVWKSRHGDGVFRQWTEFYSTELLYRSYLQYCDETRAHHRMSRTELGKMMTELYMACRPGAGISYPLYELDSRDWLSKDTVVSGERPHGYSVGTLQESRTRFSEVGDIVGEWGKEP